MTSGSAAQPLLCGRTLGECLAEIERFHTWKAPGLVIGLFMVDWARELARPGVEFDAVVETTHCLPDAVQLFTPCTVGNGWLKVLDWDKFALTLYDRRELGGYRVWLDLEKTQVFPKLHGWYLREIPKRDLPLDVLLGIVLEAGRSVLSTRPIRMADLYGRNKKGETGICPGCGEGYALRQGPRCLACQGQGYYRYET